MAAAGRAALRCRDGEFLWLVGTRLGKSTSEFTKDGTARRANHRVSLGARLRKIPKIRFRAIKFKTANSSSLFSCSTKHLLHPRILLIMSLAIDNRLICQKANCSRRKRRGGLVRQWLLRWTFKSTLADKLLHPQYQGLTSIHNHISQYNANLS